jgi:hypothetical protein
MLLLLGRQRANSNETAVAKARRHTQKAIFTTGSAQVQSPKAAQLYSPIYGVTNDITSGDVAELARVYRFFSLQENKGSTFAIKEELAAYKTRIAQIHPLAERLDGDGKGTFAIQVW